MRVLGSKSVLEEVRYSGHFRQPEITPSSRLLEAAFCGLTAGDAHPKRIIPWVKPDFTCASLGDRHIDMYIYIYMRVRGRLSQEDGEDTFECFPDK